MSRFIAAVLSPWLKSVATLSTPSEHRGWGEKIEWHSMSDGLKKAAAENKYMMVIVHLMTCPACVRNKTWFSRSAAIADLSHHFVMVNVQPWEVPKHINDLAPDGSYVPRIVFMSPSGRVLHGIRTNHPDYGYVYMDENQLVQNMKILASKQGH